MKDLRVERHRLETPLILPPIAGREMYVHPLVGKGEILLSDSVRHEIDGRRSVFNAPTDGWLLHNSACVIQPHGSLDLIIASASAEHGTAGWHRVTPREHEIGYGNHRRTVYEILGADSPGITLRCGETLNEQGGWSSWPAHHFETDPTTKLEFEEVFVPFMRPTHGLAILRRNGRMPSGEEVDDAIVLRSGVPVDVPFGVHPIVGGPETTLMYAWFMVAGGSSKRYGQWAETAGTYL